MRGWDDLSLSFPYPVSQNLSVTEKSDSSMHKPGRVHILIKNRKVRKSGLDFPKEHFL